MVVVQGSTLTLPRSSLSSPCITSLLFEPHSLSLALMHSDSSFSLYPSVSPLSPSPLAPPLPTTVPPPSWAASFLLLQPPTPNPRVIFVVAGPHNGGAAVLFRFWVLRKTGVFAKATVLCSQSDLKFEERLGVVVNVNHGISIKLAGSTNFFAMHSVSSSKVWVFAVKMAGVEGEGDDGLVVRLMKCAVVDCSVPVYSMSISFEVLILGEENGVRVLPLRPLVKGRRRKQLRDKNSLKGRNLDNAKLEGRGLNLPNGAIRSTRESNDVCSSSGICSKYVAGGHGSERNDVEGKAEITANGYLDENIELDCASENLSSVKLEQNLGHGSTYFVAFKSRDLGRLRRTAVPKSAKAISVQAIRANRFLILDSVGDLHLLCLSNIFVGSEITCHMRQLSHTMNVRKLAVLPDNSMRTQTVWMSDGLYSVHMMALSDADTSASESDRNDSEEKQIQFSVFLRFVEVGNLAHSWSNSTNWEVRFILTWCYL